MSTLDRAAVAAVDSTGQLDEVLGLPEHLEDALWRFDSAGARPVDAVGGVIVAGMGGSASGGRLALAALGSRLVRPMVVSDGYALPGWAGPSTLVLASSYSGETEETLAAYDDAASREAPRIVTTTGGALAERARRDGVPVVPIPGGFQPRAAIGYSLVAALEAAALGGAAPSVRAEIEAAAALAASLVEEWGPDGDEDSLAKSVARAVHGTVPVIAGAELAAAAAYRWKTPVQRERVPARPSPRRCRRPITTRSSAGRRAGSLGPFSYVSLEDPGRASAQRAARRADRGGRARRRRAGRARRGAGRRRRRAARLARPARRPRLDLRRRAARRRSGRRRRRSTGSRPRFAPSRCSSPYRKTGAGQLPCWPMSSIASEPASGAEGALNVASLIGGEARSDAPGGTLTSTNPANTAEVVASIALGDASTFVDAARAARAAQKEWAAVPAPARGRVIAQVGRLVEANKEALARLVTREIGKPYPEALGEVQEIVDTCDFFLGEGRRLYGQTVPVGDAQQAALHLPHAGRRGRDHHRRQLPRRGAGLVPRAGDPVRQLRRLEAGGVQRRAGRRAGSSSSTPAACPAAC